LLNIESYPDLLPNYFYKLVVKIYKNTRNVSHVTGGGHMSREVVTCHGRWSHVTGGGHMSHLSASGDSVNDCCNGAKSRNDDGSNGENLLCNWQDFLGGIFNTSSSFLDEILLLRSFRTKTQFHF